MVETLEGNKRSVELPELSGQGLQPAKAHESHQVSWQ